MHHSVTNPSSAIVGASLFVGLNPTLLSQGAICLQHSHMEHPLLYSNHPLSRKGAKLAKYGNQTVVCWDACQLRPRSASGATIAETSPGLKSGPFAAGAKCRPDRTRVVPVVNM